MWYGLVLLRVLKLTQIDEMAFKYAGIVGRSIVLHQTSLFVPTNFSLIDSAAVCPLFFCSAGIVQAYDYVVYNDWNFSIFLTPSAWITLLWYVIILQLHYV